MPVAGMMTPVRSETFENLLLDAGAFFVGLNLSSIKTATALRAAAVAAISDPTKCLGATRGGGQFVVNAEERQREVDGVRYRFVGSTARDSVDAYLSTTLLEVIPGNIKRVLATADVKEPTDADDHHTEVTMHTRINAEDHIAELTWIGDLADGRLVAITLFNALNTAGMNMTYTDKGEATMPVEFHAHQGSVEDYDTAPFIVRFFDDATSGG